MQNISIILQLFDDLTKSQKAQQANQILMQIRQQKEYFRTLMTILLSNIEMHPSIVKIIIVQVKNLIEKKGLEMSQLAYFRQNFINILGKYCDQNYYNVFRKFIEILTIKFNNQWLQMESMIGIIEGSNYFIAKQNICWFFSALVGIPEGFEPYLLYLAGQNKAHPRDFYIILQKLVKRTQQCNAAQLFNILNFIYKFISGANPQFAHTILQNSKTYLCNIGTQLWKFNQSESLTQIQILSLQKSRQYYINTLNQLLVRQQSYSNNIDTTYQFDVWRSQNMVTIFRQFIKILLNIKGQMLYLVIKFLKIYIKIVRPMFLVDYAEQLLYIIIPQILHRYTKIIIYDEKPINYGIKQQQSRQIKTKILLLQLWKILSMFDLKKIQEIQPNKILNKQKYQKIKTQLSSFQLHFKFIFQKISQTQTFFSSFIKRSNLAQNSWDLNNQQWLMVAFDLLKAIAPLLYDQIYQNIKKSMPSVLITFVVPKLSTQNILLQNHAITVIAAYQSDFAQLNLSINIISTLQKLIIQSLQTKSLILTLLPILISNNSVYQFIKVEIEKIVKVYIAYILKKGNNEVALGFNTILKIFGYNLKQPQKYLIQAIDYLLQINLRQVQIHSSGISQCISSFARLTLNYDKLQQKIIKIVKITLLPTQNYNDLSLILLQQQLLRILSNFFARKPQNQSSSLIFITYSLYISQYCQDITKILDKQIVQQSLSLINNQIATCFNPQDDRLPYLLWILHSFSIHQNFHQFNTYLDNKPIKIYLQTLNKCIQKIKLTKYTQQSKNFQLYEIILYGLIYIIQDFDQLDLDQEIFVDIWVLAFQQIFNKNKEILFVQPQQYQITKEQLLEYKFMAYPVKKRLVQLLSTMLWVCPNNVQVSSYLKLIQDIGYDYNGPNYRKRIILGLTTLLRIPSLLKYINKSTLNILLKLVTININKQLKYTNSQNYNKNIYQSQSYYSDDSQNTNDYNFIQFNFNIDKVKLFKPLQEIDQFSLLIQSIDMLKRNNKKFVKVYHQEIKGIQEKLEDLLFLDGEV